MIFHHMTPEKQQSPFSRVAGRAAQGPWPEALLTLAASASFPRRLEKVTVTAAVVQPLSRVRLCDPVICTTPGLPVLHRLRELFIELVRCLENRRELSPSSGGQSPPAGCQQGCAPLLALGQLPPPRSRGPLSSHTASLPGVCTSSLHLSPKNTRPLTRAVLT